VFASANVNKQSPTGEGIGQDSLKCEQAYPNRRGLHELSRRAPSERALWPVKVSARSQRKRRLGDVVAASNERRKKLSTHVKVHTNRILHRCSPQPRHVVVAVVAENCAKCAKGAPSDDVTTVRCCVDLTVASAVAVNVRFERPDRLFQHVVDCGVQTHRVPCPPYLVTCVAHSFVNIDKRGSAENRVYVPPSKRILVLMFRSVRCRERFCKRI
jgi:hypothetical protein